MTARTLFCEGELRDFLRCRNEKAKESLLNWDPDKLLAAAEADVIAALLDAAIVDCVTLHRDEAYLIDPTEVLIEASPRLGQPIKHRVIRYTLVVPFTGDAQLLNLRASTFSSAPPWAELHSDEVRLFCDGGHGPAQVKTAFDRELNHLEQNLAWTCQDIEAHNRQMEQQIPQLVAQRRATLLAARQLQAEIGYPIRRRTDAASYSVPFHRRRIAPQRQRAVPTSVEPFQPEPVLADSDYEAALQVLLNARNALERSPSMTTTLSEEQIRDLLLINLNAQFEGKAAGEVFNGAGKTDILIRVQDRNIFIGECKIWRGPKTVTDALDQLLTYLVWRDTKAALLLFIKQGDVTAITRKAISKIEEHSNYKRPGKHATEDRYDFVLHANGDPAREIRLALLPFLVAKPR